MQLGFSTRRVITLLTVLCLGALLCGDEAALAKPRKRAKRAATHTAEVCKVDADCALVVDGCCGCNAGGKQRAVLTKARTNYEKRRKSKCRQTMCPALMSEDASCVAGHAVCKEGNCTLGL
jgi:hypothetical protein